MSPTIVMKTRDKIGRISLPSIITSDNQDSSQIVKPLNLDGGQCAWCGKYGHQRISCPLLK
ncbi:hypothetical protein BD770DRAFT_448425 [Pilaira anomala]|nr:hypothetical protein BD770DRAFT_448425 [Pilaira anomala]